MKALCAPGPQEHALCGLACDAFDTGDVDAPVVFAATGQQVTCEYCRHVLDYVRDRFQGYRYVADRPTLGRKS